MDSVSHIGPLTNNPSEAKRLQLIRPDQATPKLQKLTPNSKQNKNIKGAIDHDRKRKVKNKTNKKRKQTQNVKRTKTRKRNFEESVKPNFRSGDDSSSTYAQERVQKVIKSSK